MQRFFINLVIALLFINVPVSVWFIGWGMFLVSQQLPLWGFLLMCASLSVAFLGVAAMIDEFEARHR